MYNIVVSFSFDAAHRLVGHPGKCRHLHGHSYRVAVELRAAEVDQMGMAVDFQVVKDRVRTWVMRHWDHNAILRSDDPLVTTAEGLRALGDRPPYLMPDNPTAENMACHLFNVATAMFADDQVGVASVTIFETVDCSATYRR